MSNKPQFNVYNVVERKGKDDFWNGLGGAFKFTTKDNRQGIKIPALQLVLIEPKQEQE